MKFKSLNERPDNASIPSLQKAFLQFNTMIEKLNQHNIPVDVISDVNQLIDDLDSSHVDAKKWKTQIVKKQAEILKMLEKEVKLVTKNHYRNTWMILGMSAIGLPIGVAFGASLSNMGFLGIGLPVGMAVGLAIGIQMDKKAESEGRQIDFEVK